MQVTKLRANVTFDRDAMVVALDGEMDAATCEDVRSTFLHEQWEGLSRIAVDLRRVGFMDSTGLALLIDLKHRADQHGTPLVLVPGPPLVRRVFDLTGTTGQFSWVDGSAIEHVADLPD